MFDITKNFSELIYAWILNIKEGTDPDGRMYLEIFANDGNNCGHGMEICLFVLIGVSILAAVIYYYVIGSNIQGATKKNYIFTYLGGMIALALANYFFLNLFTGSEDVFSSFNVFKVCLIDILYYTIIFEVVSLLIKKGSKAGNIDLLKLK